MTAGSGGEADVTEAGPDPVAPADERSWSHLLQVWRSPEDQPGWARPLLLVVTALAALSYSWDTGSTIEIYYAAAVRSMSERWHDFAFGAFDPLGTITVDKLPGALWVQAISVRLFGWHEWALLAPQAVEGALTVLVLYHCVQRLAGPLAGLLAVVVLAASPATVTLDRGNIPDTLMILLLVLAADSTVTAMRTGRWRSAAMAGLWVALAFQAKMVEAWLVLPALALAYFVAGRPDSALGRLARLGVALAVSVLGSLAYMTFVALTPAGSRPYVDGSSTNSIFHMVFSYNGFSRVGSASPNAVLGQTLGTPLFSQFEPGPAWNRLLTGTYGHDTGWLLPAALVVLVAVLVARRGRPRTDTVRAGTLLWGLWLVVLAVVFTVSTTMNSYYAGALTPAVAGLLGIGGALAWQHRRLPAVRGAVAGVVLVTVGYAAWLLPDQGTGLPGGLGVAVIVVGVAAAVLLLIAQRALVLRALPVGAVLAALALLLVPAVASGSVVTQSLGPFDTPFQPQDFTAGTHAIFAPTANPPGLASIQQVRRGAPFLMAAQTSAVAAPFIYATGDEVLPLGGYTGVIPAPSAARVASWASNASFHLALLATPSASPGAAYIAAHCVRVSQHQRAPGPVPRLKIYYCVD